MKPLVEKFGAQAMERAVYQITWTNHQTGMVELHPQVRKHCKMLLGPPPEEWDAFYANLEHPPPNPYKKAGPEAPKKEKRPRKKK